MIRRPKSFNGDTSLPARLMPFEPLPDRDSSDAGSPPGIRLSTAGRLPERYLETMSL